MVDIGKREDLMLEKLQALIVAREKATIRMAEICEQQPELTHLMIELSLLLHRTKAADV